MGNIADKGREMDRSAGACQKQHIRFYPREGRKVAESNGKQWGVVNGHLNPLKLGVGEQGQ